MASQQTERVRLTGAEGAHDGVDLCGRASAPQRPTNSSKLVKRGFEPPCAKPINNVRRSIYVYVLSRGLPRFLNVPNPEG